MNRGKYVVGIDLGGTTVKGGIVRATGEIESRTSTPTPDTGSPDPIVKRIVGTIGALIDQGGRDECAGIGIGSPGMVSGGVVRDPPNLKGWREVDLGAALASEFGIPVGVENDANVAALAELRFGAGRGLDSFIFVIWGTGVGGGFIIDRKIFHGPHGGAGEIGHVTIDMAGPLCGCGNRGCVEAYIGQRYLSETAKRRLNAAAGGGGSGPAGKPGSAILSLVNGDLAKIEPAVLSKAAEAGDDLAVEILTEAGTYLGTALASVVNVIDVRVAVIGGGISAVGDFVLRAAEEAMRARILRSHRADARVVRAALGNSAGILGAASLVL